MSNCKALLNDSGDGGSGCWIDINLQITQSKFCTLTEREGPGINIFAICCFSLFSMPETSHSLTNGIFWFIKVKLTDSPLF